MSVPKPIAALAAGSLMLVGAAALAQGQGPAAPPADPAYQALVLEELAQVTWLEKSEVAALREGVVEKMELKIGMPVEKGGAIGYLHHKTAELTVAKAKRQADSVAPKEKAEAQKKVALSVCARNKRLNDRKPGFVSAEDVAKADGELEVSEAQSKEADENRAIAAAELELAVQALEEHTIRAPFAGIVTKRMKEPGESVHAGGAVVQLGNLNKLCADAYVPVEFVNRVKEDQIVEIRPVLNGRRSQPLPIERRRFRGKITFVDPEVQPVAETAVRVRAEFDNPPPWDLKPGMKAQMTIFLPPEAAVANAPPPEAGATKTARTQ
jgi:RND family efflux transporter MFP subunit